MSTKPMHQHPYLVGSTVCSREWRRIVTTYPTRAAWDAHLADITRRLNLAR